MQSPRCALFLFLLAAAACDNTTAPDNTGSVRVSIELVGLDVDSDGFTVSVDGGSPITITPPDSATISLDMGHHTVTVEGVAPNCTLSGPQPRSIAVNASETVDLALVVSCTALTGMVEVRMPTTGLDLDPDGFGVSLDGGPAQALAMKGVIHFANVPGGPHEVTFDGLAPNCSAALPAPVGVSVSVGTLVRDTARVVIGVACVAVTGVVEVRIQSSGPDLDQDGFAASLDGGTPHGTLPNDVVRFAGVPGGAHTVDLAGIAPNCSAAGPMPRTVTVAIGGATRDTARVTIAVSCLSTTGVIEIQTATAGPDADPNGFTASVDGGVVWTLPSNGLTRLTGVTGGDHSVVFSGFAANCTSAGPNPAPVNIAIGGAVQDTVHLTLNVTCVATTGVLRVRAVTAGPYQDPSFWVYIDGGPTPSTLLAGATLVLPGVLAGTHSVLLADVAGTCTVSPANPALVTVAVGDTTDVVFDVTCNTPPTTGAMLVLTTTGVNQDSSYHLTVWDDCYYYCYTQYFDADVPANGSVALALPPGEFVYIVSDVAANCTGTTFAYFTVVDQQVTTVPLPFNCVPSGTIAVTVPVTGVDPDGSFTVYLDGSYRATAQAGVPISFTTFAGNHVVSIGDVAPNCAVNGPNPVTVNVVAEATTNVTFPVGCQPNPLLQVTVTTTGTLPPPSTTYLVGVDPDYYYGNYWYSTSIPSNGAASLALPPGQHFVTLDQVPGNCTVTSANNVTVTMTLGSPTNLAFTVLCH